MELYNIEIEEAVIGMLMNDSTAYSDISHILNVNCFYEDRHKDIFLAIESLEKNNQTIDVLSVYEVVKKRNTNITAYDLSRLSNQVAASNIFLISHSQQLYELFYKRELQRLSFQIMNEITNNTDIDDISSYISKTIDNLDITINGSNNITDLMVKQAELIDNRIKNHYSGKDNFIKPPYKTLSNHIYYMPGDLIILAGRPGMGKTAFALHQAKKLAEKYHVCIFNLEMTKQALIDRLILSELPENFNHIDYKNGKLRDYEHELIVTAMAYIKGLKLHIFDVKDKIRTVYDQKRIMYQLKKKNQLDFGVIDYLGLMEHDSGNANKELGKISMELKLIGEQLDIPLMLIHQLNREVEKRPGKRPQLSDLRDSGELEQNADIVQFIVRPEYYGIFEDKQGDSLRGISEIILAKNRDAGIPDKYLYLKHSSNIKNYSCLNEEEGLPF